MPDWKDRLYFGGNLKILREEIFAASGRLHPGALHRECGVVDYRSSERDERQFAHQRVATLGRDGLWQSRSVDAVCPIVYLDALCVKIREAGHVRNKAIHVAIGINMQGNKEVLGLWAGQAEGANFWLQALTELRNRGVSDVFIACVDGLKGFLEAIDTVFPQAQVQLCIVHQVRASLNYVSWKRRKAVAADLQPIIAPAQSKKPGGDWMSSPQNGMEHIRPSARCGAGTGNI